MTFDEIVDDVMDRLNLTSLDARERIGKRLNTRYRRVVSAIGMQTSQRIVNQVLCQPLTDTDLPEVAVPYCEKIYRIYMVNSGGIRSLKEKFFEEVDAMPVLRAMPSCWAVKLMGPGEVTIKLDAYPEDDFTLYVEGFDRVIDLEGSQEPFFPEDFHDILIEGVMCDELRKMEKPGLAKIAEDNFALRLSDMKFFISKSSTMDVVQGKNRPSITWYRPWFSRSGQFL